ncbi:MAG: DUF1905 domain-containing protein [Saprospiraceae bacterium]|nr:DUF1905 domain-containing protein [Saprospiraceae bacterium]
MNESQTNKFSAIIEIIGINPFVHLPDNILKLLFIQANRDKGKIPVKIKIDGHEFIQTLIRYSGHWRLYLNTPMRNAAKKQVGETAEFEISFDPAERVILPHPKLKNALEENKDAKIIFDNLSPSRQLEIIRYISFLKTEVSVDRNVLRTINFLLGKERFIARDKP